MADNIKVVLSAVDGVTPVFKKVGAESLLLQNQLGGVAESLRGSFAGIAGGFTLVGVAETIRSNISSLAALDDAAEKTGASVEKLSGLFKVAKISGFDTSLVEQSLVKLSKTIEAAGDSGSEAAKALKVLGLSQKDLAGKDTAEALKLVADRMNQYADGSGKTALAMALLGKSGAEAIPYMKDLADEVSIVGKATAEQAAMAEEYEKNLNRLSGAFGSVGRSMAAEMLPMLNDVAKTFVDTANGSDAFAKSIAGGLTEAFRTVLVLGGNVAFVFKGVGNEIGGIAAQLAALASGDFKGAGRIGDMMKADAEAARSAFDAWEMRIMNAGASGYTAASAASEKPQVPFTPPVVSTGKASKGGDPYAAQRESAKEWAKYMEAAGKATDDLAAKSAGLSKSQERITALISSSAWSEFSAEMKVAALMTYGAEQAAEDNAKALESLKKAAEEAAKAQEAENKGLRDRVASVYDMAQGIETELENYGKTRSEIEATTIARLEEELAIEKSLGGQQNVIASLEEEIALRKRAVSAMRGVEANDAAKKAAEEAARSWENFSRDIESSLTDALYRSFEAGGDMAETFADNLERTFKAMVLKAAIQTTVTGAGNYASAFINGATGGQFGSANAATGQIGNSLVMEGGKWVYNNAGSYLGFGSSAAAAYSGTASGYGIAAGNVGTTGSIGTSLSQGGMAAGQTSAASGSAAAASSSTSWLPIVGWIIAGMTLANSYSKQGLGYGGSQTGNIRDKTKIGLTEGSLEGLTAGFLNTLGVSKRLSDIISAAPLHNNMLGDIFGGKTKMTGSGLSLSVQDGRVGEARSYYDEKVSGGLFSGSTTHRRDGGLVSAELQGTLQSFITEINDTLVADLNKTLGTSLTTNINYEHEAEYFTSELKHQLLVGLQQSDFGDAFPQFFDGLRMQIADGLVANSEDEKKYDAALQNVQAFVAGLGSVADALDNLNIKATGADLYEFAEGGIDPAALSQSIGAYYDAFFSEEERAATRARQLGEAWKTTGIAAAIPETKEEFRALVESLSLTTEEGRSTFASLMSLAPAFAEVADAAESTAAALIATARNTKGQLLDRYTDPSVDGALAQFKAAGADVSRWLSMSADDLRAMAADYVSALDPATASGQALIAQLGELAPAFDVIVDAARTARANVLATAQNAVGGLSTLVGDRINDLEGQRAAELEAIDTAITGYRNQQQAAQDAAASLNRMVETLAGTADRLSGGMSFAGGSQSLTEALTQAAAGRLPTLDALKPALDAVSQISADDYATRAEFNAARFAEVAKVQALEAIVGKKADGEEARAAMYGSLIASSEQARTEVNSRFDSLIDAQQSLVDIATEQLAAMTGESGFASIGAAMSATLTALADLALIQRSPDAAQSVATVAGAASAAGVAPRSGYADGDLRTAIDRYMGSNGANEGSDYAIYAQAVANGVTSEQLERIYGKPKGSLNAWAAAHGLPAFAAGGLHSGGLRLVGENGPELEVTGPSRIYNAEQTRTLLNNTDIVAELVALRAEVAALRRERAADSVELSVQARRSADALNGNPEAPMPVETV